MATRLPTPWLNRLVCGRGLRLAGTLTAAVVLQPRQLVAQEAADLPEAASTSVQPQPWQTLPPHWIQWLGWSHKGPRLAWRQGPDWAPPLPGSPVEIALLGADGHPAALLHQTANPGAALAERAIHFTRPLRQERKAPADVLVRSGNGRVLAVVVRRQPAPIAAVLEKKRRSYDPLLRWPLRGPADRVDVMAFEDVGHRFLALVVHTDAGPDRQAQLALVPLTRRGPQRPLLLTPTPLPRPLTLPLPPTATLR